MIDGLSYLIPAAFVVVTSITVGFLIASMRPPADRISRMVTYSIGFWTIVTGVLAISGFYLKIDEVPPRIFLFGAGPLAALFLVALIVGRNGFIRQLDIRGLTLLHAVRIPVEIVLFALFKNKLVPEAMTFEGFNFDILTGISALVLWYFGFRDGVNRPVLIVWNIAGLIMLAIIVTTAVSAFPSPLQSIAFDQPNIAVAYFPFSWLPTIVVPIVFFAHIAALWKLLFDNGNPMKSGAETET